MKKRPSKSPARSRKPPTQSSRARLLRPSGERRTESRPASSSFQNSSGLFAPGTRQPIPTIAIASFEVRGEKTDGFGEDAEPLHNCDSTNLQSRDTVGCVYAAVAARRKPRRSLNLWASRTAASESSPTSSKPMSSSTPGLTLDNPGRLSHSAPMTALRTYATRSRGGMALTTRCCAFSAASRLRTTHCCKVRVSTLPATVLGSRSKNCTCPGHLRGSSLPEHCASTSRSDTLEIADRTMQATTSSPISSSGVPMTAHSSTPGSRPMSPTSSAGMTLTPPWTITSFTRPTMQSSPLSFR